MPQAPNGLCYLCGQPLVEPVSSDHVPPKQLFARAVRKAHSPHLLTIPVHDACNKAYQHDEDYFVHTLMPFARKILMRVGQYMTTFWQNTVPAKRSG